MCNVNNWVPAFAGMSGKVGMDVSKRIIKLILLTTMLSACSSLSENETQTLATDNKANKPSQNFACSDGLLVDTADQCVIYDPILPVCFDGGGNFNYVINSIGSKKVAFSDNFKEAIPSTLIAENANEPETYWSCKLTKLEIIGHADPKFGNEAQAISEIAANHIFNAYLEYGVEKELLSMIALGGTEPYVPPELFPVTDPLRALNNHVTIKTSFEF